MLRSFTDSSGVQWRVWSVTPNSSTSAFTSDSFGKNSLQHTAFANGWLCFESDREKRRLAPIPPTWESEQPQRLEELCGQAAIVPTRRSNPRGARSARHL